MQEWCKALARAVLGAPEIAGHGVEGEALRVARELNAGGIGMAQDRASATI
jgi:hypothetical protein